MCPELQGMWSENRQPEHWEGVTMENSRVVKLELEKFDLTGAVPAEVWRLSALRHLDLRHNQLDGEEAHVAGGLHLFGNQLDALAGGDRAAHGADGVGPQPQSADERAGGDRAAHVAGEVGARRK